MAKKSGAEQGISAEQAMQAQGIMQQYQAQQQAAEQAKKGKPLRQTIDEIVGKTGRTIKKLPGEYKEKTLTGLDGILGSGLRSTTTTYAAVSTALPIAFIDPIGAALAATFAGAYAFFATNTVYKVARDTAWLATYPILRPSKMLNFVPMVLSHPLQYLGGAVKAPFKMVGFALTYPFKVKREKIFATTPDGRSVAKGEDGKPLATDRAGVNRYAATAGKLIGGYAALSALYGSPIDKLKDVGSSAVDHAKAYVSDKLLPVPK